jgi:hypothetical protein
VLLQPPVVVGLEIAGTACRLACDDRDFAARLARRYAAFPPADEPAPLAVEITLTSHPASALVAEWSGPYARVTGRGSALAIAGLGFSGAFDEATGRGTITQPPDHEPLETLLTAIYASRLLGDGGCMLHAAAIVGRAGALVFFGPSGSGKTTVAELIGEDVITDEITAIRPAAGAYVVSSVPWRGQPRAAPLAGLFRLRQATTTAVTPLSPRDAVRALLPSVFFCRADGAEFSRFLESADRMARAVPAYELAFTRDRSFWDVAPGAA